MTRIKWLLYFSLLALGLIINLQQFVVEAYMRFSLRNQPIVFALTTTPHRINDIQPTVETILKQNIKPSAIYISIPTIFKRDNIYYVIPEWLLKDKRITILRTDDYGPATKILGVLANTKLEPNTIIITFDDDIKYPSNTALQLAYPAMRNANYAFGISGAHPAYTADGYLDKYYFEGLRDETTANASATILKGYAGVAYRKSFFDDTVFAITNAPSDCVNSDDLYLSFYLANKNIGRKIIKNKFIAKNMINYDNKIGHQSDALHKSVPDVLARHYNCIMYMKKLNPSVIF